MHERRILRAIVQAIHGGTRRPSETPKRQGRLSADRSIRIQ